jgi:hypothetical protein
MTTAAHSTLDTAADQHSPFVESATAPGSPATGLYWLDTDDMIVRRYNGSAWIVVSPDGPQPGAVPQYASGDWVDPWVHGCVPGTVSAGFNVRQFGASTPFNFLVPIYIAKDTVIDAIGCPVNSADTSLNYAKFALRPSTADGLPGATLAETSDVAMNGSDSVMKFGTISNLSVAKGLYYVQMTIDANASFTAVYITPVMTALPYDPTTGAAKVMFVQSTNYANEIADAAWTTLSGVTLDDVALRLAVRID